jgi:hypothetical protein
LRFSPEIPPIPLNRKKFPRRFSPPLRFDRLNRVNPVEHQKSPDFPDFPVIPVIPSSVRQQPCWRSTRCGREEAAHES